MTHSFESIELLKGSLNRLSRVCDAIDNRLTASGASLDIDQEQDRERLHLSEPERIVRTLTSFFCCCSNAGTLYEQLDWGLRLLPDLERVGAHKCAKALRELVAFSRRERELNELLSAGTITDQEYDHRWAIWTQERNACENDTEGDFEWADLVWIYASENRAEILPEERAAGKEYVS